MVNYANGKVYKLVNNVDDEIYVGSTCSELRKRKNDHKSKSLGKRKNQSNYQHLNQVGWDNIEIILIEAVNCNNKDELHRRERYWIETLKPSLNKQVPGRTKKQYTNRDEFRQHRRNYFKNNIEQTNKSRARAGAYYKNNQQKLKQRIVCACGKEGAYVSKLQHEKSKHHQAWQKMYDFIYS